MDPKPTIILATNRTDPALELRDVERFDDGSGFSAELFVVCHGFSAQRHFSFSEGSFRAALKALRQMDEKLQGEARLDLDWEKDQFLQFAVDAHGHVTVSGQLVHPDTDSTRFTFAFETDQTCLAPLLRSLERLKK